MPKQLSEEELVQIVKETIAEVGASSKRIWVSNGSDHAESERKSGRLARQQACSTTFKLKTPYDIVRCFLIFETFSSFIRT